MEMVNYLTAYAPHLATVAAQLTRLYGATVPYKWQDIHEKCMEQVKKLISAETMLKPLNYDSSELIYLITDVSLNGLGGWIGQGPSIQDIRPAAFYS